MSSYYDFEEIRDPVLREKMKDIFDLLAGHDHDGTNSKAVSVGTVSDGTITNAKLATDVKAGSLAALTTTEKSSLQGAINEVDLNADAAASAAAAKYTKPGGGIPSTDMTAAVQASLGLADTALQDVSLATATPVNAANASKALTIDGVAIDGETVSIGADVYEFCADAAQSLTAGSTIAIDITSLATASQGTLTVDTQPTAGDTMTIGSKTYTFVPHGTANADGEVDIGTDLATAQANIVAAINGSDGYNVAHTLVSAAAFGSNDSVITALIAGVAGDLIATTETFTAVTNIFDAGTLGTTTAGVDCTKGDAKTALIAEVTASDTQGVGAADGGGDVITLTADVAGVAGNSIALAETMAHGAFAGGAVALSGGVDGTVGTQWLTRVDASYLYVCIAAQTIADKNWRRIALGSTY